MEGNILVSFPFKKEDIDVVTRNVQEALKYERTGEVLLVGYEKNETYRGLKKFISHLEPEKRERVKLILQKRIGTKRPGKGDGMNTALEYFARETEFTTLHFYDSDIITFNVDWIKRVQKKIDEGFKVVRCYYPRAITDAMITWNITKCGLAYLWPHTLLPEIGQPLGGELAVDREVALTMVEDEFVRNASDWSIDTAFTIHFVKNKFSIYEVYIEKGKLHRLYGKLSDLKTMLIECFQILQENQNLEIEPDGIKYERDKAGVLPEIYRTKVAYDIAGTIEEFKNNWNEDTLNLLEMFPQKVKEEIQSLIRKEKTDLQEFTGMGIEEWFESYVTFLKHFVGNDENWKTLLFNLWMYRVLCYTNYAVKNPEEAMGYLQTTVEYFKQQGKFSGISARHS